MNETEPYTTPPRPRNPWIAAALSAILPGLGHFYAGRRRLALWMFLAYVAMANVAIAVIVFADFAPLNILLPVLLIICSYSFVLGSAIAVAKRASRYSPKVSSNRWYHYALILLATIPLSSWVLPVWGDYEAFKVPSQSMQNGLMQGDYFMADKRAYRSRGPEVNDIVVFRYPLDPEVMYVKRCAACPGDTIAIRNRQILLNGEEYELPETMYWKPKETGFLRVPGGAPSQTENLDPYVVPDDCYFMLSDNLSRSSDSRFWGPVHRDLLVGKAVRIHWSADFSRVGLPVR